MARPISPSAPDPPREAEPGQVTFSPAAQPIRDFMAACFAVIDAEMARVHHLHRYDSMAGEAHEAWMRLHEEDKQTIRRLGALGIGAIRAGALAGEAAATAELVRNAQAVVRDLHGWVNRWWDLHGDAYTAWRKRYWPPDPEGIVTCPGACTEFPPEFIDRGIALLRPAEDALYPLMNRLNDIAVAVPFPGPAQNPKHDEIAETEPHTVWYHGGLSYSTDGTRPLCVSNEQHNVLQAFVDRDEAHDTAALSKTGVNNVTTVMNKLAEKFGEAVQRPQNKGDGYFIRVRTLKNGDSHEIATS